MSNKFTVSFFLILFSVFFFAPKAYAGLLYVSPADGSFTQGDKISIQIFASTPVSMNAASGILKFDPGIFSVESVSKAGSILSFWVEEPSFSNSSGLIRFEGVSPGSGYLGTRGKVIGITFRALRAGSSDITFESGSMLANDGSGTNIISSFGDAEFDIKKLTVVPPAKTDDSTVEVNPADFYIEPLKPPHFEEYKNQIGPEEFFAVKGNAEPNSEILFQFKSKGDNSFASTYSNPKDILYASTNSDSNGKFAFILEHTLKSGYYEVSAIAKDGRGARSEPSNIIDLSVKSSTWSIFSDKSMSILSIIVPLFALIILSIFLLRKGAHLAYRFKKDLRKDIAHTESSIHKAFKMLKEDMEGHVKMLEKTKDSRSLTREEEKIFDDLKENLSEAEEFLIKEIKDINKGLG